MAVVRTPRRNWVDAGLRALASGGPEAVRIQSLARTLGVTKGGFYGYFPDRRALLREMLDEWERAMIDEVIERVECEGGDPRTKLRNLFALATSPEARPLLRVDLAVRDWSRRDKAVARRLRRVDNRRMEYMRTLFRGFCEDEEDVEARSLVAFSLFVANRFIAAEHGPRTRSEALRLALRRLLD